MGSCFSCFSCFGCCSNRPKNVKKKSLDKNVTKTKSYQNLVIASKRKHTTSGCPVNIQVKAQLFTTKLVEQLKNNPEIPPKVIRISKPPFSSFTEITPHLFLTGIWGMTKENIQRHDIKSILSIYYEMPRFQVQGIDCIRLPLEDSHTEKIEVYFDDISNTINTNTKNNVKTVIHCAAGARRSFTLVLAYLMKYKKMDLKTAFIYVYKKRRTSVALNMNFFVQLMSYEKNLFGKNSVHMIDMLGQSSAVPDFIAYEFPELLADETINEDSIDPKDDTSISIISVQ